MGTMPVGKQLLKYVPPTYYFHVCTGFLQYCRQPFCSKDKRAALTAVSMSFPAQNIMISAGTGVGVGITALIARYLGAKDKKGVTRVVHNGLFSRYSKFHIIYYFWTVFCKILFQFQRAPSDIEKYGIQYLSLCSFFAFFHHSGNYI